MQVSDDLYLGGFYPPLTLAQPGENPTINQGVGPMGRVAHLNFIPLTLGTTNAALAQTMTSGTALTLTAGTGVTSGTAPDGSGRTVLVFDVARAVSLTSVSNLSAINFTVSGFDVYGQPLTATRAGPNNTTVNTTKTFKSILSITPGTTSGSNVAAGTSDVFGMPFCIPDVGYITAVKWAETLAQDAGTFVAAVTTTASATTGDTRGTYTPSSASNGTRRLVIQMHLTASQCGASATQEAAFGVAQA